MGRILMEFQKQLKDQVYRLLQEPTLEEFRNFLHAQMGEHNDIRCQTPGTKL